MWLRRHQRKINFADTLKYYFLGLVEYWIFVFTRRYNIFLESSFSVCLSLFLYSLFLKDKKESVCKPDRCFQLEHIIYKAKSGSSVLKQKYTGLRFYSLRTLTFVWLFTKNFAGAKMSCFKLIFCIYKC